jgi:hypothetical protein
LNSLNEAFSTNVPLRMRSFDILANNPKQRSRLLKRALGFAMRVEDDGTSAAGALVSNTKNKRGVIKAFIVSNRPCLGT